MWLAQTGGEVAAVTANNADRLEFLIVLIGVIVGLSIGRLVNFIGDFLVHRQNGRASLVHGTFVTTLFLYQVYYWWDMWDMKETLKSEEINLFVFIRMLLIPLCLFCATALLCPKLKYPEGEETLSLGNHFDQHCRPFYIMWILLCLIGISQGLDLRDGALDDPHVYISIAAAFLFLIGAVLKKTWFNGFLAVVLFVMLLAYITVPLWEPYWSFG